MAILYVHIAIQKKQWKIVSCQCWLGNFLLDCVLDRKNRLTGNQAAMTFIEFVQILEESFDDCYLYAT